jgi:hypothetical protein
METPVEAITERAQISGTVFGEIEGMVGTAQTGFEIAQYRINPTELG